MSDTAEQSGKVATDVAYTLALAGREEAERRLAAHARRLSEPAPSVTFLIGAGRAGFRGGFDPAHPGVLRQFARADGVTMQGIRADAPEEAARLAAAFRAEVAARAAAKDSGPALPAPDADALRKLLEAGVKAHTETLLRTAPLLASFGSLVPQTRVRIRATGSVNYGRSIPTYPEEWGGGKVPPRQPRPARRLAGGGHSPAGDRLQPRLHDPRPARGDERPRRPRPTGRGPPRPARARATARSWRASCRRS